MYTTDTPYCFNLVFFNYPSCLVINYDAYMTDLVPLRQINAGLKSAKEVLARIHEIVLA